MSVLAPPQGLHASSDRDLRVVASRGDSIVVIHRFERAGAYALDLDVEPGAQVTVVSLLLEPSESLTVRQRGHIAEGGTVRWQNVTLGANDVTWDLESELLGANAESTVTWASLVCGDASVHLRACNRFLGPAGRGEITLRGVAQDSALLHCDGTIVIGPNGAGTQTYLAEHVLMLDARAKVDAIPRLEIATNDVRASHSATVSRVTEEDLFTFAARGIAATEARLMFIEGFLSSVFEGIDDVSVRSDVARAFEEILHRGFTVEPELAAAAAGCPPESRGRARA